MTVFKQVLPPVISRHYSIYIAMLLFHSTRSTAVDRVLAVTGLLKRQRLRGSLTPNRRGIKTIMLGLSLTSAVPVRPSLGGGVEREAGYTLASHPRPHVLSLR